MCLYFDLLQIYLSVCSRLHDKLCGFLFSLNISDIQQYIVILNYQSECEEENECKNDGEMVWDPVKPFKCLCPKNYVGELCEKSE